MAKTIIYAGATEGTLLIWKSLCQEGRRERPLPRWSPAATRLPDRSSDRPVLGRAHRRSPMIFVRVGILPTGVSGSARLGGTKAIGDTAAAGSFGGEGQN